MEIQFACGVSRQQSLKPSLLKALGQMFRPLAGFLTF